MVTDFQEWSRFRVRNVQISSLLTTDGLTELVLFTLLDGRLIACHETSVDWVLKR